ncbi:MAG: hypothetical protein AB1592_02825 [Pseudomonadota bacterium]
MPEFKSANPDDAHQNAMDQANPPIAQAAALRDVRDHATHHQGGGPTGSVGGDRPAESNGSPLPPVGGREHLPGDDPAAHGEAHWDAPLTAPLTLSHPAKTLHTLRDGGDLVSGRLTTIPTSFALRQVGVALARAAKSGSAEDIAAATRLLQRLAVDETLL